MNKIAVLLGGNSPEKEVSLVSGQEVIKTLESLSYEAVGVDPGKYPLLSDLLEDLKTINPLVVFNALHGGSGENGELAAALGMAGFVYTGSDYKASCLAMDKYLTTLLAKAEGIPVPECIVMRYDLLEDYQDTADYASFADYLGLPIIVKPNDAGSSVGITKVDALENLKPAVQLALKYSSTALLEQYIPGRELTVTVLDGTPLPVVEIKPLEGWYDYTNKYNKGKTNYEAPADLDESVAKLVQLYAYRMWKVAGLSGYARIDFRYDDVKPYFLEINTLPGMTPLSLTPMAAKAAGMSFAQLLERIIKISLRSAGR